VLRSAGFNWTTATNETERRALPGQAGKKKRGRGVLTLTIAGPGRAACRTVWGGDDKSVSSGTYWSSIRNQAGLFDIRLGGVQGRRTAYRGKILWP